MLKLCDIHPILQFGAAHLLPSMCAGNGPVAVGGVHEQGEELDTGGLLVQGKLH